jgi:hypothetical protein
VDEPPPDCPKDQTWNPERGCVPVATEPPAREPEQPTGDVYVEKRDCKVDSAASLNPDDLRQLAATCPANTNPIDMTHTPGESGKPRTQSGTSEFFWPDQPSGRHVIQETVPAGYGEPWVYCTLVVPGEDRQAPARVRVDQGSIVVLDTAPSQDIYCLWFNIPEKLSSTTNAGGVVDIYKSVCPLGVPPDMDVESYQDECKLTGDWDFKVEWADGTFTTDANGFVGWTDVPPGEWRIAEALPEGYGTPVVWCRWLSWPPDVEVDPAWFPLNAADGIILIPLKYGDMHIECRWLNMMEKETSEPTPLPTRQGDTPTPIPEPTYIPEPTAEIPGAELTIFKFECPAGYIVEFGGVDPLHDCATPVDGVEFSLEFSGSTGEIQSQVTSNGALYFGGLASGEYAITEIPYAGIQGAFVWNCSNHGEPMPGVTPLNYGNVFLLHLQAGDFITCYWFNIPAGDESTEEPTLVPTEPPDEATEEPTEESPLIPTEEPPGETDGGTLMISKFACPPGVSHDLFLDDYRDQCTTPGVDIVFEGSWGVMASTSGGGHVQWVGVPLGSWQVSETLPEGYETPVVYCVWLDPSSQGISPINEMPVGPNSTVSIDFPDDEVIIECEWFNIPADDDPAEPMVTPWPEQSVEVQVYKLWCSEEATSRTDYQQLVNDLCTFHDRRSASVTVSSNEGSSTQTIVGQTAASWDVTGDTWTISEAPVDGYIQPVAWCQVLESDGSGGRSPSRSEPYRLKATGWSWIPQQTPTGGVIACAIFNIPEPTDQSPSGRVLDLYNYSCPFSSVPFHSTTSMHYLLDVCEPAADWSFQVEALDSSVVSSSDQNGFLSWRELPEGQWAISRSVPSDHQVGGMAVWCQYLDVPPNTDLSQGWFPVHEPLPNATDPVALTVEYDGIHLECHWFNRNLEVHHLDVRVRECPRFVAGKPMGQLMMDSECRNAEVGTQFALYLGGDGEPVIAEMTQWGVARWRNVPDGTHALAGPPGLAGIPAPQVWCARTPVISEGPYWFTYVPVPVVNGTVQVMFEGMNDQRLICQLFAFTFGLGVSGTPSGLDTISSVSDWYMNEPIRHAHTRGRCRAHRSPTPKCTAGASGGTKLRSRRCGIHPRSRNHEPHPS